MAKLGRPLAMTVEQRRKEIFLAAEKLFGNYGFENVTMAQIATETGMSKKTLYAYFSDKRALLKSLVESSYIWPEEAFPDHQLNCAAVLKQHLKTIAEHVLSERHIKLCRLSIAEHADMDGISNTFYEMGIASSRNHLIAAIEQIAPAERRLALTAEILADMLFGASIAKPFLDELLINKVADLAEIHQTIDKTVDAMLIIA